MKKLYKVTVGQRNRGPYIHVYDIVRETGKSYYLGDGLGYSLKSTKNAFTSLQDAKGKLKELIQRKINRLQDRIDHISLVLTPTKMAVDALEEGSPDDVVENLLAKAEILKVVKARKPKKKGYTVRNGNYVRRGRRLMQDLSQRATE